MPTLLCTILQTFLYFSALCLKVFMDCSQDHSHNYCHIDSVSLKNDNFNNTYVCNCCARVLEYLILLPCTHSTNCSIRIHRPDFNGF